MVGSERPMEAHIEELLELEQEIQKAPSDAIVGNHDYDTVYEEGFIAGAERVPTDAIPTDYPVPITSDQALRLDVETVDGIVETYIEWAPHGEGQGHVGQLLNVLGREPDEFANIFGDKVALDYRDGYYGIDPEETRRLRARDELSGESALGRSELAVLPGTALSAVGFLLSGLLPTDIWAPLVFLSIVLLPTAVYVDSKRIPEQSDWDPFVFAWIVGGAVPFVNAAVGLVYLLHRRTKTWAPPKGVIPTDWLYLVRGAGVMSLLTFVLVMAEITSLGAPLYLYVLILLPVAIYADSQAVAEVTDEAPSSIPWALGAAGASFLLFGFFVAGIYLYSRKQAVDD